jgi:hypothetical protein
VPSHTNESELVLITIEATLGRPPGLKLIEIDEAELVPSNKYEHVINALPFIDLATLWLRPLEQLLTFREFLVEVP